MSVIEHSAFAGKTKATTMSAPPPTTSSCHTLTPSSCGKYCACEFPSSTKLFSYRGFIPDLITCRCGETPASSHCEWLWDNANTAALSDDAPLISANGKDILFHPSYSHGTAIVRGNQALARGRVHYWEMRILTMPSGTAVMFGIGSDQLQLNAFQFHFISALGTNSHSWGYSYQGRVQHMGIQRKYGHSISQGSIVGVLVDLTHGYLEFYLNRQSLGIAYTNVPTSGGVKLYPIVCSTAARSCVRLIGATSVKDCLQYRCLAALSEQAGFSKCIQQQLPPGMHKLLREYWFLALTEKRGALSNRQQCAINKRQGCAGFCSKCDKHEGGNNLTSLLVQTERVMRSSQRLVRKQKFRNTRKTSKKEPLVTQIEESEGADECAEAELHEDDHGTEVQRKRQVSTDLDDAAYHGYFHYML